MNPKTFWALVFTGLSKGNQGTLRGKEKIFDLERNWTQNPLMGFILALLTIREKPTRGCRVWKNPCLVIWEKSIFLLGRYLFNFHLSNGQVRFQASHLVTKSLAKTSKPWPWASKMWKLLEFKLFVRPGLVTVQTWWLEWFIKMKGWFSSSYVKRKIS